METTRLSSKGQVIIPKAFRTSHRWASGLELLVIDTGDGILLKPKIPFDSASLDEVAGCLKRDQAPLSLDDMTEAVRKGLRREWRDRN